MRLLAPLSFALLLSVLGGCVPTAATPKSATSEPPTAAACAWAITNTTGFEVVLLQFRKTGESSWGADTLGADTMPDNATTTVSVEPGTWDVRATDVDDDTYTLPSSRTCANGEALSLSIEFSDLD